MLTAVVGAIAASLPVLLVGVAGAAVTGGTVASGVRAGDTVHDGGATTGPTGVRWGRAALGAVALVLVTAGAAAAVASRHQSGDLFTRSYPDDVTVCRGPVDESCARAAADRSHLPVAWLPDTQVRTSQAFVVWRGPDTVVPLPGGAVFQEGRAGWVHFDLHTNPGPPEGGQPADVVRVSDTTAAVRIDTDLGASVHLDWSRDGVAYRLSAFRTTPGAIDSVVAEATRLLGDVRDTTWSSGSDGAPAEAPRR